MIAVLEDTRDLVIVFLNDGNAGFSMLESFLLLHNPTSGVLEELDGDGDLDFGVVTIGSCNGADCTGRGATIHRNDGRGRLTQSGSYFAGIEPTSLVAADLDLDGDRDLVAGNLSGEEVVVLLNDGEGGFPNSKGFSAGRGPALVAAGNLDGDGLPDLAISNLRENTVSILLNAGGGEFPERQAIPFEFCPLSLVLPDLDGDRSPDLAVLDQCNRLLKVFRNDGRGSFTPTWYRNLGGPVGPRALVAGDFDRDGDSHLMGTDGSLFFLENDGWGGNVRLSRFGTSGLQSALAVADLDGDSALDAVAVNGGANSLRIVLNRTAPHRPRDCNRNSIPDICDIAAGREVDCDKNGVPDRCEGGPLPGSDLNGNGFPDDCEASSFHRGDTNSDGLLDISDSLFTLEFLFLGGQVPRCLESADADNDGSLDITDGISILAHLFLGAAPPPAPGSPSSSCGPDPDPPGPEGYLGCLFYPHC